MRANSAQPRGSLCLKAWRIGASAYFAAAAAMPSSANILPVSAAIAFMASRLRRVRRRAPAAAGGGHRQAALRIADADMQRGVGAHRVADHVRLVDAERVHHGDHVVAGDVLRVAGGIGGHVGGRIAALAVGDAAVLAAEVAHLRLPAAVVAGVFVHEHDRRSGADLLDVELGAVRCGNFRHCGAFGRAAGAIEFVCVQTKG